MKGDVLPKLNPPRKILASLWEKIKEELDNIEKAGVINKITRQQNGQLMVVVKKSTARLRICLDPETSANLSNGNVINFRHLKKLQVDEVEKKKKFKKIQKKNTGRCHLTKKASD